MTKKEIELYDKYSIVALSALIRKTPLVDKLGELEEKVSDSELKEFQASIAASAHFYAIAMFRIRKEALDSLEED